MVSICTDVCWMGNHDSVAKGGTEAQVLELGDECGWHGYVLYFGRWTAAWCMCCCFSVGPECNGEHILLIYCGNRQIDADQSHFWGLTNLLKQIITMDAIATGWRSLWQVTLIFLSTGTRAQICSWILQLVGLHNSLLLSQVQHQERMLYVDTPSWRMLILTFQTEINRIIMGCGSSCRCDMFSLSKQACKTLFIQKWCIVVTYL